MTNKKYYKTLLFYLAALLLPILIMVGVLYSQDIYPGSSQTILTSDGFHQYVIFATGLRNILHGDGSLFYTFTSGLGLNFYALTSYYLGSFLSPLYYFFTVKQMADAFYFITILKFGLIGLSGAFSFKHLFTKVSRSFILCLSTGFSLMSFATSQLEISTWLDAFILAPLIILGLHLLLRFNKRGLYFISLTCLFIQNYYFGYMMAIFLTLYTLIQLVSIKGWKNKIIHFFDFGVVSILSGLSSAIMLLPTLLDLTTHGEKFTSVSNLLTDSTYYFDFFAKNLIGAYDTTKFGSIPMIYVGLLPLILFLLFFVSNEIKLSLRLSYLLLFTLFIVSFYIQPFDLFWQGMHAPNMFLHRYSWLLSLLSVLLAGETLNRVKKFSLLRLLMSFLALATGFLLTWIFRSHYSFIESSSWLLSLAFLLAYAILFISYYRQQIPRTIFQYFTFLFCIFELSLSTYYVIGALGNEWVFPSREGYLRNMSAITKLVSDTRKTNKTFYRTERIESQTGNDSMKFNYNGISQFSSIRNTASSSTLDRLGFKSEGTNLNLRYQNNTIIADSLFGIKYNLWSLNLNKYGFYQLNSEKSMRIYQNNNAAQLAILTDGVYKDTPFTVNTLDNQSNLLNALSGLNLTYFKRAPSQLLDKDAKSLNQRVAKRNSHSNKDSVTVTYQVTTPPHSQLYVSIPNISWSDDTPHSLSTTVNGVTKSQITDNTFDFFDLGYFEKEETITVGLTFYGNKAISFDNPSFYALNTQNYQTAMDTINQRDVKVTTAKNKVFADYNSKKEASLFFTIPYDKGWTATVNSKKVKIYRSQKGFMKVNIPSGKGKVVLTFVPYGFKLGLLISCLSSLTFCCYAHFIRKSRLI